jgi:hypothetical protein
MQQCELQGDTHSSKQLRNLLQNIAVRVYAQAGSNEDPFSHSFTQHQSVRCLQRQCGYAEVQPASKHTRVNTNRRKTANFAVGPSSSLKNPRLLNVLTDQHQYVKWCLLWRASHARWSSWCWSLHHHLW